MVGRFVYASDRQHIYDRANMTCGNMKENEMVQNVTMKNIT